MFDKVSPPFSLFSTSKITLKPHLITSLTSPFNSNPSITLPQLPLSPQIAAHFTKTPQILYLYKKLSLLHFFPALIRL
jgi:hypothetical protein